MDPWETIEVDRDPEREFHVVPLFDAVVHEPVDCVCGPTSEPHLNRDGDIAWLVTHHSLDGREAYE